MKRKYFISFIITLLIHLLAFLAINKVFSSHNKKVVTFSIKKRSLNKYNRAFNVRIKKTVTTKSKKVVRKIKNKKRLKKIVKRPLIKNKIINDASSKKKAQAQKKLYIKYPWLSRKFNEEGDITLKLFISQEGIVKKIEVIKSSGHQRLDAAAIEALIKEKFIPAFLNNKPISSTLKLTFSFRINDR